MTYVVTEDCVRCLYQDCIEVCPVECFHIGEHMLVINPDECIDCGVCEPECPAEAIIPDTEPEAEPWLRLNDELSRTWPVAAEKGDVPKDADDYLNIPGKLQAWIPQVVNLKD